MDMLNSTRIDYAANNVDSFPEIEVIIKNEDDSCPAPSESEGVGVILQADTADSIDIKYEFPELTPSVTKKRRGRPPSSKQALATPFPASTSRKRKKDSSSKPSIASKARKGIPSAKVLKEPVPSTSSSLPLTKPCTVKLIRLRLDTASNIIKAPLSVLPCNLLAALPLIHNYLEKEDLINCRLICKVWKRSVDNYLARKRRLYQLPSNTAIRDPVPSTSSSLSATKTCAVVKPTLREDVKVKEEILSEDDKYEAATVWVDDIETDDEEIKPPDESQLITGPQENLEVVADEKIFLEALPLLLPYFDNESTKCIINCRAVCRPWRDAVDNYLTDKFLKVSLSDLQSNTKVSNLICNFPKINRCEYHLDQMKNHLKNPFIGHAVRLDLPKSYPGGDTIIKVREFLQKYGKHIWTLYIDGNWGELDLDICFKFITNDVLLKAPNIKNLIITKSLNLGTKEIYGIGTYWFRLLERVEISDLSDITSQNLLKCLSGTEFKTLCVDSLKNVIQFEWPTLKELFLKPKETVIVTDEEISRTLQTWSKLELLGIDFTRVEPCFPNNWVTFNCVLKSFQFAKSLKTIRCYSTPLWYRNLRTSDFLAIPNCPENIKTIEVYDNYPETASIAFGNYFDYSFLHCFPQVENLKIVQEKPQGRFLREASCLNEAVKVHQLINDGRMYESNIWEVMPALQELTVGRRIYKREIKRRQRISLPPVSEPLASLSSDLSLKTSYTNAKSPKDVAPDLTGFSEALPLLSSYLTKQFITKCRLVCRSWRDAVDNYVTTSLLKASLSDLQKKTVSPFLYKFTEISARDYIPTMENHPKNPFIGHAVHLHLPEERKLTLIIPKFLKQFGQHIWTLHISGDWDSFDSGPLLPFITDDVLLPAPNIKNLIISKSLSLGSLEIYGKHPFEFLERVEISEVSDLVSKPLLKRFSKTQLKILCLDNLDNFIHLEWPTLKELHLKDFRLKDDLSIINAPQLELLELGLNMECWSSGKYEYSIFGKILNGLQSIRSLNAIRFSFYSTSSTLWINQYKRTLHDFSELAKCPENIKTVEIHNACFKVKANVFQDYSEGFEFANYSFLLCFPHVENLKIVQEKIPTRFLLHIACLNDNVKVHQFIYDGKMYESNIWEEMPALQELHFGRKIYKRSSFIRNPKLRIGTQSIQQGGEEPGPSRVRPYYRTLSQNSPRGSNRPRTTQTCRKSTGGVPRHENDIYLRRNNLTLNFTGEDSDDDDDLFQCRKCPGKVFRPDQVDEHIEMHRRRKRRRRRNERRLSLRSNPTPRRRPQQL